jgi:hypothetical protein
MTPASDIRLYHTGIIVDDLDEAMCTFGAALNLHWMPPLTATTPMRCPTGVEGREVRFTYGLEGPHHIELLEQIDPTPYLSLTGGRYVHHLGYYTADLAGSAAMLEEQGFKMELSGVGDSGEISRATFHHNPLSPGIWIELVSHEIADEIGGRMAQAAADQGIPFRSPFGPTDHANG